MGQVQSDQHEAEELDCETGHHISQDVTDLEINSKESQFAPQHHQQQHQNQQVPELNDECDRNDQKTAPNKGKNVIVKLFSKIATNINKSEENSSDRQTQRSHQQADSNISSSNSSNNNNSNSRPTDVDELQQDEYVRKLSIVSHRNIQLLSMKPWGDMDAYADELRTRRRSSLINLILGAPSSGPRFSDDLCSLSSHMSELCNFGIEFFPNYNPMCCPPTCGNNNNNNMIGPQQLINCSLPFGGSYYSSFEQHCLGDSNSCDKQEHKQQLEYVASKVASTLSCNLDRNNKQVGGASGGGSHDQRRRSSSVGSLASSLSDTSTSALARPLNGPGAGAPLSPRAHSAPSGDDVRASLSQNGAESVNYDDNKNDIKGKGDRNQQQPQVTRHLAGVDKEAHDQGDNEKAENKNSRQLGQTTSLTSRQQQQRQLRKHPSLASTLKSIDLTSSFEQHDKSGPLAFVSQPTTTTTTTRTTTNTSKLPRYSCSSTASSSSSSSCSSSLNLKRTLFNKTPKQHHLEPSAPALKSSSKLTRAPPTVATRVNQHHHRHHHHHHLHCHHQSGRLVRRSGSELSLYSTLSGAANSELSHDNRQQSYYNYNINVDNHNNRLWNAVAPTVSNGPADDGRSGKVNTKKASSLTSPARLSSSSSSSSSSADPSRETKLIIMLQVCLPFILAGFGNMAAGLVLNQIAHWRVFKRVPMFFVLLPSFVGLKGNIEMTLASRLSTLSNLKLLHSSHQRRHAYVSNLILILSQAIGLSLFAALLSILCEICLMGNQDNTANTHIHIHTNTHAHTQTHTHNLKLNHRHDSSGGHNITANVTSTTPTASTGAGPFNGEDGVSVASGGASGVNELFVISGLVVLPSALITAVSLVVISSFVMSSAIALANYIQVNPDNLSTLIAALYGDVTCVLAYGLFADLMYSLHEQASPILPIAVLSTALISYPILCYLAYQFKETHSIALTSMPPMLTGILVSMGSGAVLSLFVGRFSLIALYQPVVNGFGANLIAVQASRVSTWLWCKELRRVSISQQQLRQNSLGYNQIIASSGAGPTKKLSGLPLNGVSFTDPITSSIKRHCPSKGDHGQTGKADGDADAKPWASIFAGRIGESFKLWKKLIKLMLWSFCNPSPNSIAARLLLIMLIPAHTLYFFVIWLLSPANYVTITWQFYFVYISLCLVQVFILLSICEPLMTLLMRRHLDPDVFGISLLMALADLVGTLCLAGAFLMLARIGDVNAHK